MTNNPFQLTFQLRQHTPIIHFQHEQAGATLRATEVKPKLDVFIMEKLLKAEGITCERHEVKAKYKELSDGPKPVWKTWLVGKGGAEHVSLDYKLTIAPSNADTSIRLEPGQDKNGKWQTIHNSNLERRDKPGFPGFFANMGQKDESDLKNFAMHDQVTVAILSSSLSLKKLIEQEFPSFLMHTNFGTRQSKGFGSFFLHPDDKRFELSKDLNLKYSFQVDVTRIQDEMQRQVALFESIDLFFRSMRSGINLKEGKDQDDKMYLKSLMAQFSFREQSAIQWDKKAIRDHFELGTIPYNWSEENRGEDSTFNLETSNPHRLMRDMLGLSSEESWFKYSDTITKSNEEIGRFKSPVLFKPIRLANTFIVYFEGQDIPKKFFGQSFKISHNPKNRSIKQPKIMSTPINDQEFDLAEFLEFVFSKKNTIQQSIYTRYGNVREANLLIELFASLKKHF